MGKVKNFFASVGRWFKNHAPTRRRIIQVYAALLTNANLKGFGEGQIYTGNTKAVCTPGLNCYSCPGAVAACPLGALQNSLGSSGTTTPYYILGIIALFGLALGRMICGFLCPFGLVQELLYKIKTPKARKGIYTRLLSYLKYLILIVLVIAVPLIYHNVPGFCKYICPAGTFGGAGGLLSNSANADYYAMLGYLFSWKSVLLVVCIVTCIFVFRAFCRFLCPLGAIYGFFNKIALLGVKLDKSQCIDCGACISHCKMDIKHVGDHECISCGECIKVCPTKAISWKGSKLFVKPASVTVSAIDAPQEEVKPLNVLVANGTTLNTAVTSDAATANRAELSAENAETTANATEVVESTGNSAETTVNSTVKPDETVSEKIHDDKDSSSQSKFKAALKKLNKRTVIMEIVAWILATAVLVSALVYYNTQPSRAASYGKVINDFTATAYNTAYDGEEYTLSKNGGLSTVIVFWNSRNEMSQEFITTTVGDAATELEGVANVVVVNVVNSDTTDIVQSIIDSHGWNEYDIPFIQDTDELNIYNDCGGEGAFPLTVFLSVRNEMYASHTGPITVEEIVSEVGNAFVNTSVYKEGDKLPTFEVTAFESAYKGESYDTADAKGKVLVINFWFISCGPCVEELPYFEVVKEEYGDDVVMVALHSQNDEVGQAQTFINTANDRINKASWADWGIIFGRDMADNDIYWKLGGKGPYPLTVVVNTEGYITFVRQGSIINANLDDLRPAINAALNG